jgi:hypothetical protein
MGVSELPRLSITLFQFGTEVNPVIGAICSRYVKRATRENRHPKAVDGTTGRGSKSRQLKGFYRRCSTVRVAAN